MSRKFLTGFDFWATYMVVVACMQAHHEMHNKFYPLSLLWFENVFPVNLSTRKLRIDQLCPVLMQLSFSPNTAISIQSVDLDSRYVDWTPLWRCLSPVCCNSMDRDRWESAIQYVIQCWLVIFQNKILPVLYFGVAYRIKSTLIIRTIDYFASRFPLQPVIL